MAGAEDTIGTVTVDITVKHVDLSGKLVEKRIKQTYSDGMSGKDWTAYYKAIALNDVYKQMHEEIGANNINPDDPAHPRNVKQEHA